MGIADPKEFVVGPGAAPAGNPPIGPVSINCGWVSKIKKKNISQEIYAYAKRQALFGAYLLGEYGIFYFYKHEFSILE